MTTEELINREHEVIYQTYNRLPVAIDRAEGCRVIDVEGNEYLDMLSGIAVNALGHSHPRIVEAVTNQAQRYMHISNFFYQEPQIRLAELLTARTGYSKIVFSNSGAEAWEGAVKLARKWGTEHNKTGNIIAFYGGFHGRTYGALSLMDKPLYKDGMGPFLPNTVVLPYNDSEQLRATVNDQTIAIGLEFVQGEGGISEATPEFVETIRQLQAQYGFLIIADEVQAGVGRTGDFFGFEQHNIKPDIVTMAKGIGGGLPLGALLATEAMSHVWVKGQQGTTYGGNSLACVAGIVVMEELQNGVLENVRAVGAYLRSALEDVQQEFSAYITEVRGRGLFLGLALTEDATRLRNALLQRRVITNATATTVLRMVPPLVLTQQDVDVFITRLRESVIEVTSM
ncbi:MAG: acetylornithine transaminase [Candidatus Kapaibacterium sp.]|nr:acetylornithine transaminase [Bacteroidota bacterium]